MKTNQKEVWSRESDTGLNSLDLSWKLCKSTNVYLIVVCSCMLFLFWYIDRYQTQFTEIPIYFVDQCFRFRTIDLLMNRVVANSWNYLIKLNLGNKARNCLRRNLLRRYVIFVICLYTSVIVCIDHYTNKIDNFKQYISRIEEVLEIIKSSDNEN